MKSAEFIKESSTLGALGVDAAGIKSIHTNLQLKHDTAFEPIKNKKEAKAALLAKKAIIAVNDEGDAWGFGYYSSPFSSTGQDVIFGMSDKPKGWQRVDSLTKALARVKGRGYKYYASVEKRQHRDKRDRQGDAMGPYDGSAPTKLFLDRFNSIYGNMIKGEAKKGYKKVRKHLMKLMGKDDEGRGRRGGYVPTHKDMNQVKDYMTALKKMSKNGLDSWNHGDYHTKGEMGALEDFFPGTYRYMMNTAIEEFQENEKLSLQKFVQYIRKEIANMVEIARTGGANGGGTNARDYKDARDEA